MHVLNKADVTDSCAATHVVCITPCITHALCYTRKPQVRLPGTKPLFLCSCATLCKACPSLEKKTRAGRNYAACLFVVP